MLFGRIVSKINHTVFGVNGVLYRRWPHHVCVCSKLKKVRWCYLPRVVFIEWLLKNMSTSKRDISFKEGYVSKQKCAIIGGLYSEIIFTFSRGSVCRCVRVPNRLYKLWNRTRIPFDQHEVPRAVIYQSAIRKRSEHFNMFNSRTMLRMPVLNQQ